MNKGAWLQYRGDRSLLGRSALKGDITSPEIKWKHFIGARETMLSITPGGQNQSVTLPDADLSPEKLGTVMADWKSACPTYDLDGNGTLTAIPTTCNYKIGKWVPEWPGMQKVETDSGFTVGTHSDDLRCRLFKRENGQWKEVWKSEPAALLYCGEPIVGDFDNDGKLEVAFIPWDYVYVLDFATGKTKYKGSFRAEGTQSGRGYGLFSAYDLNGDGKKEFMVHSDMENQVNVVGWDASGNLVQLWSHLFEHGGSMRTTLLQSTPDMIQDVDGDGMKEIAVAVYNEKNDDKYHTLVLDSMTGAIKLDIPDQCLLGMADVDGDGVSEMFCSRTQGRLIPDSSEVSVFGFKNKRLSTMWQQSGVSFQLQPRYTLPDNSNSIAQPPLPPLMVGPMEPGTRPVFVTRRIIDRHAGKVELNAWQANVDGKITMSWSLQGPNLEAVGVRKDKADTQVLVRATVPGENKAKLAGTNANVTLLSSHNIGAPLSTVVAGSLDGKSRPTIIAQGACERVVAFQPEPGKQSAKAIWQSPGRGMYSGIIVWGGIMLADVLGNGQLQTIAATRSPEGCARLVVLDPKGKEVWRYDLKGYPGGPPAWNTPGLMLWYTGNFRDKKHCDIWVNFRPNNQSESMLLDGRTGKVLWRCAASRPGMGSGGSWVSVFDFDDDGLDDILSFYPGAIHVIKGTTGKLLFDPIVTFGDVNPFKHSEGGFAPLVADFLGNGQKQMLYAGGQAAFSLLQLDRTKLWEKYADNDLPIFSYMVTPAVGDFDGDGKLDVCGPATPAKEVQCYRGDTGEPKWKVTLDGAMNLGAVSCDIDGDGRDEAIQAQGSNLYAIGSSEDGKSGVIKWKISLPNTIGPVAIADVDGSGKPQIIVVCADGYVYGVGAAKSKPYD